MIVRLLSIALAASAAVAAGSVPDTRAGPGRIVGTVAVKEAPVRRTANRYPGQGGGVVREVQRIPAIVFIEGPVPGAPAAKASGAPVLAQQDTAFQPSLVVVPTGTTVNFPNRDPFFHNVFSYSKPKRFDLGRYPQGESRDVEFDLPGVVKVFCEVHKHMQAVVLVVENPYYAEVAEDGRFAIENVPPGRYRLVLWHADRGDKVIEVDVPEDGTVRIDETL